MQEHRGCALHSPHKSALHCVKDALSLTSKEHSRRSAHTCISDICCFCTSGPWILHTNMVGGGERSSKVRGGERKSMVMRNTATAIVTEEGSLKTGQQEEASMTNSNK